MNLSYPLILAFILSLFRTLHSKTTIKKNPFRSYYSKMLYLHFFFLETDLEYYRQILIDKIAKYMSEMISGKEWKTSSVDTMGWG